MNKRAIIVSGTMLLLLHVHFSMAGISLPTMFRDNMVFQRDELRTAWGKSDPKVNITVSFGSMLKTKDEGMPRFFEIAEYTGGSFLPARAVLEGNTVILWNEKIEKPRDVRFAFSEEDLMNTNLVNFQGIPTATFWAGAMPQLHPDILNEMKNAANKP